MLKLHSQSRTAFYFLLLISLITLSSCPGVVEPTDPILTGDGTVMGYVTTFNGAPIQGVKISVEGMAAVYSEADGKYTLLDVPAGYRVRVNYELPGFISTQKVMKVINGKVSPQNVALAERGSEERISSSSALIIEHNGAELEIPPNVYQNKSDYSVYSGDVFVKLTYYNPRDSKFYDGFPGIFKGYAIDGSGNKFFETFGYINVEILDGMGNELEIIAGNQIKVTIPIQGTSAVPDVVPMWYYNSEEALWKEEGEATRIGGNYVGYVEHLSYWTVAEPIEISYVSGTVKNTDAISLAHAKVYVYGTDYIASFDSFTDSAGVFNVPVKAGSAAQIQAFYISNSSKKTDIYGSNPGSNQVVGIITIDLNSSGTQDEWVIIPPPLGDDIFDIQFLSDTEGWLSSKSHLMKTDDGGDSWQPIFEMSYGQDTNRVYCLHFVNPQTGWIAGTGFIYKTTDNGTNWELQTLPTVTTIKDLFFANDQIGWAAGDGKIFGTSDGGTTWIELYSGNVYLESIQFIGGLHGWAVGSNGTVLYTSDGQNWQLRADGDALRTYRSVYFFDENNGWVAGGQFVARTTDGGYSWEDKLDNAMYDFNDITFSGVNNGWVAGSNGKILYTSDDGKNWSDQPSKTDIAINALYFRDFNNGWAAGQQVILLQTTSGGK